MTQRVVARTFFYLILLALCISLSALLSSWFVTRQLSAAIKAKSPSPTPTGRTADAPSREIDFYEATGISSEELQQFLREAAEREHAGRYPALVTLQNNRGDYLADSRVIVRWDTGEQRLLVGQSGVVRFFLDEQMLAGLKVIAPEGFHNLRQRSIPLGSVYDADEPLDHAEASFHVHYDGHIQTAMIRGLHALKSANESIPSDEFQEQLRRPVCTLDLTAPRETELTAAELYQLNRDSVVIIGHLYPDGQTTQATGFVLDASGVVVTNYHVVDKPTAVARGVLTSSNRMHTVTQVLAADKSNDVALLQVAATDLRATPLADAALEGSAVTLISHPNSHFYSLTRGHVSRYWATTSHGRVTLRMGTTAEFAGGSSGAPLFDTRGNVVGIASTTKNEGYQMVHRAVIPAPSIRQLIRPSRDASNGGGDAN